MKPFPYKTVKDRVVTNFEEIGNDNSNLENAIGELQTEIETMNTEISGLLNQIITLNNNMITVLDEIKENTTPVEEEPTE